MSQENNSSQEEKSKKKNGAQILQEELLNAANGKPNKTTGWRKITQTLAIPVLAIFSGLVIGGLFIILTTEEFYVAWSVSPWAGIKEAYEIVKTAYLALFTGAIGDPVKISQALQSGDPEAIRRAFNPFFESLVASTPYIFGGLAVALGFRAGLFNIGVEGQIFI